MRGVDRATERACTPATAPKYVPSYGTGDDSPWRAVIACANICSLEDRLGTCYLDDRIKRVFLSFDAVTMHVISVGLGHRSMHIACSV